VETWSAADRSPVWARRAWIRKPRLEPENHDAIARGVHRVQDQVHDRLLQEMGASEHPRQVGCDLEGGADGLQGPLRLEQTVRAPRHRGGIERRERLFLRPRVVEQTAHDAVEAIELAGHAADHLRVGPRRRSTST